MLGYFSSYCNSGSYHSIMAVNSKLSIITIFQVINIHLKTIEYLKQYDTRQIEEYNKLLNQENAVLDLKKADIRFE